MTDDLYQEIILEHARRPHNSAPLVGARSTREHNPLCGDSLELFIQSNNGQVEHVAAITSGCALSRASASIMTDALRGKTPEEAEQLIDLVARAGRGEQVELPEELKPLESVAGYPARVKCVTMSWHAAKKLLDMPNESEQTPKRGGS